MGVVNDVVEGVLDVWKGYIHVSELWRVGCLVVGYGGCTLVSSLYSLRTSLGFVD